MRNPKVGFLPHGRSGSREGADPIEWKKSLPRDSLPQLVLSAPLLDTPAVLRTHPQIQKGYYHEKTFISLLPVGNVTHPPACYGGNP